MGIRGLFKPNFGIFRHVRNYSNLSERHSLFSVLNSRGLISHLSDQSLESVAEQNKLSLYCGADPSADSLHVGNLMPLIVLLHFMIHGHNPVALVGGATGEVGDPSGRSSERQPMVEETRVSNVDRIKQQMNLFFQRGRQYAVSKGYNESSMGQFQVVNNALWWKPVKMLDFLATYGRHIRVSQMIARDSVKNRLMSEQGLGLNEFVYQVLQAYDFWHLYKSNNCLVQVGGNDQWGNISAGIDLISRLKSSIKREENAFGLTVPLLTTPSGEKFGKSAGNAVWIDREKTSVYHLYQYLVTSSDEVVEQYLKLLTLVPLPEIEEIMNKHRQRPESRLAQRILALEVTNLIHGIGSGERASVISSVLFPAPGDESVPTSKSILEAFSSECLLLKIPSSDIIGQSWRSVIASISGKSKSEAGRMLKSRGVYWGLDRQTVVDEIISKQHVTDDSLLLIRLGKSKYHVIQVI